MKTKRIKFTRPPAGAFGLAYFVGDDVELPVKQANELIKLGYAEAYTGEAGDDSDLPADLPGRPILVDLDMSLEELKQIDDLTEIEGIGKATAARIKQFLIDAGLIPDPDKEAREKADLEAKEKADLEAKEKADTEAKK